MKIGNISLPHGLILAPMAGDTDRAMRETAIKHGAEYVVTEMVSAKAITYGDDKSLTLGRLTKEELPAAVQLFGHDPYTIAKAALSVLEDAKTNGTMPSAFDINMGCPVKKIAGNGDGSALMKTPEIAYEIVKTLKQTVSLPVTVKMRTGWNENTKNAPSFAELMEKAGADAICVHGRTREEMYAPPVDKMTIKVVKKAVSVPVVANGGIYTVEDAKRMLDETECDGLMIGRGALGNPWLFGRISAYLDGREFTEPTGREILDTAFEQLRKACLYKGEHFAVLEGRRQVAYYLKGFKGAPNLRDALCRCNTYEEVVETLRPIYEN